MMQMTSTAKKADEVGRNQLEITVILKDSERTYRHKFLVYEDVLMNPGAAIIQDCIREARQNFQGTPTDIVVKASLVVL